MAVQEGLGLTFFLLAQGDGCAGGVAIFVAVRFVDVECAAIFVTQDIFTISGCGADNRKDIGAVTAIIVDLDVELDGGLFLLFRHDGGCLVVLFNH